MSEKERDMSKIENWSEIMFGQQKYCILMMSDFVFPKFGGVETHGY